jgi:hypothetical protein
MSESYYLASTLIVPKVVIPAKAGIQKNTGFRIKSGMTFSKVISETIAQADCRERLPAPACRTGRGWQAYMRSLWYFSLLFFFLHGPQFRSQFNQRLLVLDKDGN